MSLFSFGPRHKSCASSSPNSRRRTRRKSAQSYTPLGRRLRVEPLEDRNLLAVVLLNETFPSSTLNSSNWNTSQSDVTITDSGPKGSFSTYVAEFDGNDEWLTSRSFNLSSYGSGGLGYSVQHTGYEDAPESDDHLHVQYRTATGSWANLYTNTISNTSGTAFKTFIMGLPSGAIHSNFAFRFNASDSDRTGGGGLGTVTRTTGSSTIST